MKNQLWVEKYRPNTVEEYVFTDERLKEQVNGWVKQEMIPHLLFSGDPGTGKTTLAKVLIHDLGIEEYDVLQINASRERQIDLVRDRLMSFAQTMPFGKFKVVLIDEADYLNPNSVQPAMRNLMEDYSQSVRFILTCNYPHKIIPAIHSRCQGFHIEKIDSVEFTARAATILINEEVEFEDWDKSSYSKAIRYTSFSCAPDFEEHPYSSIMFFVENNKFNEPIIAKLDHLKYASSKYNFKMDLDNEYGFVFCDKNTNVCNMYNNIPIACQIFEGTNQLIINNTGNIGIGITTTLNLLNISNTKRRREI